ncbi:helix-turn-helix domain-containing protein [Flagellimonas onchidii]|uniref:helix-turn-helix domain-containing protein n=1 Tax=Flagellimonas onchidii TaxID=2562684 RepID=UPI0014560ED7|nr:helix-turn-helix transcriptional regulator [Allomuricauda onchidii]
MSKHKSLKKYREQLGISQLDMSKILQISQSAVSQIENGKIYGKGFVKYLKYLVKNNIDINDYFKD